MITRRFFLKSIGIAVSSISLASKNNVFASSKNSRPNVIFIITDDQRRSDFSFLEEGKGPDGKPLNLTPNIDRLSSEGVIFENQHVTSPACTPSRFSVLTGTYASRAKNDHFMNYFKRHGVGNVGWNTHILPTTGNLAKTLKKAGYTTGAVGKNHVIECKVPKPPKGASYYDPGIKELLKDNQKKLIQAYKDCGFDYASHLYWGNIDKFSCRELEHHNMEWVVEGAVDFIDKSKDKPFFLYMATTLNHGPGKPGERYKGNRRATPVELLDKPLEILPSTESIEKRLKQANITFEHAGDNLWLDDGIGAVVDKLKEHKLLDNTIIFFFNDHGVEAGKASVYHGGTHSVSFVWGKKIKGGRRVNQLVSNIDFAPTIMEICKADEPGYEMDGKSLLGLLKGDNAAIHDALFFEFGATRGVLKDNFKYIAFRLPKHVCQMTTQQRQKLYAKKVNDINAPFTHLPMVPGGYGSEQPAIKNHKKHYFDEDQLYNLSKDPKEQINLASDPKYKAKLEVMKKLLRKHLAKMPGNFGEFKNE